MKSIVALGITLMACGKVSDTLSDGRPADSTSADAPSVDAAPPRCNPTSPFGTPMALDALNSTAYDVVGSLSTDELTLFMSSDRTGAGAVGGLDVYVATRPSRTAAFGAPSVLAGINTTGDEGSPLVTADGLFMYVFTHTAATGYDILVAQRASTAIAFGTPTAIPSLNSAGISDAGSYVLPDNSAIYFQSNRNGSNDDVLRAARNVGGTFDPATAVSIPTSNAEDSAVLTPDELTIFYASNAPGGAGGFDIYMATRSTKADGFGTPQRQTALSTTDDEFPSWISPDGCELYFSRTVTGRSSDIFIARRAP